MTDRVSETVRRSQLKCYLTNHEAASWWDVWDTGRAEPFGVHWRFLEVRVLANEGLQQPSRYLRGVPNLKVKPRT